MSVNAEIERRIAALHNDPAGLIERFDRDQDGRLDDEEWAAIRATIARDVLGMQSNCPEILLRGRYQLISSIGHGAQGQTYLAHDTKTSQLVAIKSLHVKLAKEWKAVELFERETEVLKRLDHPGIPTFIDAFEEADGTEFYLVQAFVPGDNLEVRLARGEMFTPERLQKITKSTLAILVYLHGQSPPVLHRDIKPANLVLGDEDRVTLVDFGAVQNQGARGTTIIGTTGYMPPEQLIGRAAPGSDLYALGATLVHLATRHHPADLPVQRLRPDWTPHARLPKPFARWIDRLLEPNVEKRPRSALLALDELQQLNSASLKPVTSLEIATLPAREIIQNTPRKNIGRVVFERKDGALILEDEGAPKKTHAAMFFVITSFVVVPLALANGDYRLIIGGIVWVLAGLFLAFEKKVHTKASLSRENGLVLSCDGDIRHVPLGDLTQTLCTEVGFGTGAVELKSKSGSYFRISGELSNSDAQELANEVRIWLLEHKDV